MTAPGRTFPGLPLLARFVGKLVLDILPAALASVIGGFLFTQYQFGHGTVPQPAQQVVPASAEMMALVRDEHAMIMNYLQTEVAAEKSRQMADDADTARAIAEAKSDNPADGVAAAAAVADAVGSDSAKLPDTKLAAVATHRLAVAMAAVRPPRAKVAAVPLHAPLVIAQAGTLDTVPDDLITHDPNSLLAKTLDLKDHVVAATRHVVSVIGDMFAFVGQHLGGGLPSSERPFSSDF
jgi:hypothetical protein